jgi:CRISPR/Cas system endoribonuclease Cas6 (RAMP superfamily)
MRYPIGSKAELKAPPKGFRVVEVDLSQGAGNFVVGDFQTLPEAQEAANRRAQVGSPIYIYDDEGKLVERYGSWH